MVDGFSLSSSSFARNASPLATSPSSLFRRSSSEATLLPWKTPNKSYHHQLSSRRNLLSLRHLSTSTEDNTQPQDNSNDDNDDDDNDVRIERYAIVSRNRQSMAFRNGSPLVFSGAIDSTVHRQFGLTNDEDHNSIPLGALVGVMVMGKGGDGTSENRAKGGGRGGKQRRSRNKRGGKPKPDEMESISKHFYINSSTSPGELYESEDGDDEGTGDTTAVVEKMLSQSMLIGYGVYNPSSLYRVRILCHQSSHPDMFKLVKNIMTGKDYDANAARDEGTIDSGTKSDNHVDYAMETIVKKKFGDAIRARKGLNLPSASTDSYRLINGEGDGLSGLAIDILGGRVAVIMSSAAWCEIYKHVIMRAVESVLRSDHPDYFNDEDNAMKLVWRTTPSRLLQDGYQQLDDGNDNGSSIDQGEEDTVTIVTENSVKYKTFPFDLTSQKTGFYVDQRENRLNLSSYCRGKRVLDLCCYTGGFSLNAVIHGGASSCVGVDSSQDAINAAIDNAALNEIPSDSTVQFVRDDITNFMKNAATKTNEDGQYDVIVLDPPKLAPSVSGLERASRKYHSLNRDAIKLINEKEGGMLLTCTCSGAMTQKNGGQYFLETVKGAALSAGRQITLLKSSGAAPCHTQCPASFPAGAYLTAALFYVSPKTSN